MGQGWRSMGIARRFRPGGTRNTGRCASPSSPLSLFNNLFPEESGSLADSIRGHPGHLACFYPFHPFHPCYLISFMERTKSPYLSAIPPMHPNLYPSSRSNCIFPHRKNRLMIYRDGRDGRDAFPQVFGGWAWIGLDGRTEAKSYRTGMKGIKYAWMRRLLLSL